METLPLAHLRETFILRVWRDSGKEGSLRCQVQSVRSGEAKAFNGLAAAFDYMQRQLEDSEMDTGTRQGLR